jgi:hypothetical protein
MLLLLTPLTGGSSPRYYSVSEIGAAHCGKPVYKSIVTAPVRCFMAGVGD